MKIIIFLLTYLMHRINSTSNYDLRKYLDEQVKVINETVKRYTRDDIDFFRVKFNYISNVSVIGNYTTGEIFTVFNNSYALLDHDLYEITSTNYTLVNNFFPRENITILKVTEYNDLGIIASVTNFGMVHIHGYIKNSQKFYKIQTISHSTVSDVQFFNNNGTLYMIITNKNGDRLMPIVLYQFLGSHFDETEKKLMAGAKMVDTFSNNGSEIIIILRDNQLTTVLYEFKGDLLKKIQKIETGHTRNMFSYCQGGKHYVLIFNKENITKQYIWTGSELVFKKQFNILDTQHTQNKLFYNNNTPFILSLKSENLRVFSLSNNQMDLLHDMTLNKSIFMRTFQIITYKDQNQIIFLERPTAIETVIIATYALSVDIRSSAQDTIEGDKLPNCFLNLEKKIYKYRHNLDIIINRKEITQSSREANVQQRNQVSMQDRQELEERYNKTVTTFENYITKMKSLVVANRINESVVFTKHVILIDIKIYKLNNKTWQPLCWLSYSKPQKIFGSVTTQVARIGVDIKTDQVLFNDLLLANSFQTTFSSVAVKSLICNKFKSDTINNVNTFKIYFQSEPVKIKGTKNYPQMINVTALDADVINKMDKKQIVSLFMDFGKMFDVRVNLLTIQDLWVNLINGINFDKLKNSVFRIGITDAFEGNLTFNNVQAQNMTFETLSNRLNVMTTSSEQTINSSITIPKIFGKNIETDAINGINFKNSIATFVTELIKGPVSIDKVRVNNQLKIHGKTDKGYFRMKKQHIVGTNVSDLLQRYNANVNIKGNLFLKNCHLSTSNIQISDNEFNPKFDEYWTKTTRQVIPTRFDTLNGVSSPHLFTTSINGVQVKNYILNSTDQDKSTKFYFEDVTVDGNIVLRPNEQHSPNLRQIDKEAVKTNGTFRVKGHKTYSRVLKIDHLNVKHLNNVDITKFVYRDVHGNIEDEEVLPSDIMVIKGDLVVQSLSTTSINNVDLRKLLETTVPINEPQIMETFFFKNISAKILFVNKLNDEIVNDTVANIKKIKSLGNIESLQINGQVEIHDVVNLSTVNDLSIDHLLNEANKKFHNKTVFGKVKFLGHLRVKKFFVTVVNDIELQGLFSKVLYKNWNQSITQYIQIKELITENFFTEKINNVSVHELIDVSSKKTQNLFLSKNLQLLTQTQISNLNGLLDCNLHEGLKNLKSLSPQYWNKVTILGDTTFMNRKSTISYIFDRVVTSGNNNRFVHGKTTFINHICGNNMTTLRKINNIDLAEILIDGVINDPEREQIVSGKKIFTELEAHDVITLQNTDVPEINQIEILKINHSIINKNINTDVDVKGKKIFFAGLQTKKFQMDSMFGVKSEYLVSFQNATTKIPFAIFDTINVYYNLNVKFLNNMPFDVFLDERLLSTKPIQMINTNYFFHEVIFTGNISATDLNGIKATNLIYDMAFVNIENIKRFTEDLEIVGNISSDFINGFKLSEAYEGAVMNKEKTVLKGSLIIQESSVIDKNVKINYMNNFPIADLLNINSNQSLKLETKEITKITEKIGDLVKKYLNRIIRTPTEYLYLEKSTDMQISVVNTVNAQIVETKNEVLIHIESEEDGHLCGLPKHHCKCPSQQTVQISSEHSISSFMNKATQRIYSYYNEDVIIHLVTNTISTSSLCRANTSDEISTLSWNTVPTKSKKGAFFLHQTYFTGYVSGVKFFTAYDRTYIIIAFYYDPFMSPNHNLNCIILQFNQDKTQLNEIQRIPTQGVKTISLIHTAQGIILILGNEDTDDVNATTTIFRFNKYKEKFEFLREVPTFGSLYAVGVVLKMDSLIILANKLSTLYILKYQKEFDNYYFYQRFQLDYPVSSVTVFYADDFGISDAYLTVVTKNSKYYIYSFQYIEGWKLESMGEVEGIKGLIPFKLNKKSYFFAPSSKLSLLIALVEHG